jgi:hypothetical protein
MKRFTSATVNARLLALGASCVSLCRGDGYWYFAFEDGKTFETLSVLVHRLNDLPLQAWVTDGIDFNTRVIDNTND